MEREIVFALAAGEWKNLDDVLELKLTWAILPACGAPENDSDLPKVRVSLATRFRMLSVHGRFPFSTNLRLALFAAHASCYLFLYAPNITATKAEI